MFSHLYRICRDRGKLLSNTHEIGTSIDLGKSYIRQVQRSWRTILLTYWVSHVILKEDIQDFNEESCTFTKKRGSQSHDVLDHLVRTNVSYIWSIKVLYISTRISQKEGFTKYGTSFGSQEFSKNSGRTFKRSRSTKMTTHTNCFLIRYLCVYICHT